MAIVGRLTDLTDLNLDYTDVGDKGLESLSGLAKLQRLSLDSTNVTDASAAHASRLQAASQAQPLPHVLHRKGLHQESAKPCPSAKSSSTPNPATPNAGGAKSDCDEA